MSLADIQTASKFLRIQREFARKHYDGRWSASQMTSLAALHDCYFDAQELKGTNVKHSILRTFYRRLADVFHRLVLSCEMSRHIERNGYFDDRLFEQILSLLFWLGIRITSVPETERFLQGKTESMIPLSEVIELQLDARRPFTPIRAGDEAVRPIVLADEDEESSSGETEDEPRWNPDIRQRRGSTWPAQAEDMARNYSVSVPAGSSGHGMDDDDLPPSHRYPRWVWDQQEEDEEDTPKILRDYVKKTIDGIGIPPGCPEETEAAILFWKRLHLQSLETTKENDDEKPLIPEGDPMELDFIAPLHSSEIDFDD